MPASNDSLRTEVLDYLLARFGVPPTAFEGVAFTESAGDEIWISSVAAVGVLRTRRQAGLRAFRRPPAGLKPTSAFLASLDLHITSSRIDVDRETAQRLLLGRRVPAAHSDGYVALAHEGVVIGCGLATDGVVHCLVPTGRRQELLDALGTRTDDATSEV